MKFQYFTYFLNPISQQSLFPDQRDKNDILMGIMEKKMEYKHMKSDMVYVFHRKEWKYLHGKLGKKSSIKRTLPSDHDFVEHVDINYPYCNLLLNLDNDAETGQKIAFEYNSVVFQSPEAQIKALEKQLNTLLFSNGYAISIHPVVDQKEFWALAKKYDGKIEKLIFTYAVPNLFNLENELSEDLKQSGQKYGITNAAIEFENKAGQLIIPENDPFMKQSAEYTGKGGGEYRLKVKGMKSEISSNKNVKTKSIEDIDLSTDDKETFLEAVNTIFK